MPISERTVSNGRPELATSPRENLTRLWLARFSRFDLRIGGYLFDLGEFLLRVVPKDLNGHLQTVERLFLINDDVLRPDEFKASAVDQFSRIIDCAL
jgi:hypothetical protein